MREIVQRPGAHAATGGAAMPVTPGEQQVKRYLIQTSPGILQSEKLITALRVGLSGHCSEA